MNECKPTQPHDEALASRQWPLSPFQGVTRELPVLAGPSREGRAYLVVLAVDVGHCHDDGEAHEGEQGELPRQAEHEDHHARDLDRVSQEDVDILGDQVADHGGVRGEAGDEVPWNTGSSAPTAATGPRQVGAGHTEEQQELRTPPPSMGGGEGRPDLPLRAAWSPVLFTSLL